MSYNDKAQYGQQPGGYPQGYPSNAGYPPQPQPQTFTVITQAPMVRPQSWLWASILTCLCCNVILGIIAIIFSAMSMSSADAGDMESARSNSRVACGLNITALVLGVIGIIIAIILYFVVYKKVVDDLCNDYNGYNYNYNCKK